MAAVAKPGGVPEASEEVLRYLAQLDDGAAAALLARARSSFGASAHDGGGDVSVPPVPGEGGRGDLRVASAGLRSSLCQFGSCSGSCCKKGEAGEGQPDVEALEAGAPEGAVSPEEARRAADSLMGALEFGNIGAAESLWRRADMRHLGETGWSALHWAVHSAGTALSAQNSRDGGEAPAASSSQGAEDDNILVAATDCGCCKPEPAKPECRDLLHRMLKCRTGLRGEGVWDVRSADGATPLMFAADVGDRETCELLLATRADASIKDSDGDTAAAWARQKHHTELASVLEAACKAAGAA
eukprot:CAMPEP_0177324178 /NCGR_PEP_ID=MMETSP0368-20130122/17140_1 /TAXON_ID=447022 ORGANISM="Scrippsiella hangoei-like, Strain SHHI-4" /NCGR_SAMPLE_ID=MMETSP0368 /ASSEMBLY_ACC=CAM_ASM_000363 /LENGTH=299 /DNA_ID=CAMNT_0018783999 /DNA_START=60 /DNA_END=959 /DNA_ORIENTATION=+